MAVCRTSFLSFAKHEAEKQTPCTSAGKNISYSKRRVPVFVPRGHFETFFLATLYPNPLNERWAHSSATCCFYVPCTMHTILVNIQERKTPTIATGLSCFSRIRFLIWEIVQVSIVYEKTTHIWYLMYNHKSILRFMNICIYSVYHRALAIIVSFTLRCLIQINSYKKHKRVIFLNFTERWYFEFIAIVHNALAIYRLQKRSVC